MLVEKIRQAVYEGYSASGIGGEGIKGPEDIQIERPRSNAHGDYASNIAMSLAKQLGKKPREIAEAIVAGIKTGGLIEKVEIAGPGFLNVSVGLEELRGVVKEAAAAGEKWGWNNSGGGRRIQVEFVSANPTGPLSVGHGRLAAFGDSLARILSACGYEVSKEYYINDVGNQIQNLAMSVDTRYRQMFGEEVDLAETGYQGEYIRDYAEELKKEYGDSLLAKSEPERRAFMGEYTIKRVLREQSESLAAYGVKFDRWFRESELYAAGEVDSTLEILKGNGHVFEKEDALWFRSTAFFDTQDRVLKKSSGIPTYFLSDIAYHKNKFDRGFDTVINIWGADHHGYIPRMKSSVKALDIDPERLEILIVQLVRFKQSGILVRMSKRAGNLITLTDLAEEVGTDVSRFFFLMRTKESHLDFDIELAKDKSEANPMYYLQYAHARICSIMRKAKDENLEPKMEALGALGTPQERELMRRVADFSWEMTSAGASREPHRVIAFMTELAGAFHTFYHDHRVVAVDNAELSGARLALCAAVANVFKSGLAVIGVSAPEAM